MKNFKYYLGLFAVFTLLFTSCSKEEGGVAVSNEDTVQLQFGALLNDFAVNESKAHETDPTVCRDAAPSYVLVGVTNSDGIYVGTGGGTSTPSLFQVNIQSNNGSWETSYSEDLALAAGDYNLEYFIVYSSDDEVLWVAPRAGGDYASSVPNALPIEIELAAGTKPYINVDVLCFLERNEEAYGYVFFDINLITVTNNYCIFVNFCDDTTGREYPAQFQVDVWADSYDGSEIVIDGSMNSVSGSGNSFAATVLCLPLPPLGDGELYYVRVSVQDAGDYDAGAMDFKEFTISQADINQQSNEVPRYEHVRINCDNDDGNGECDQTNPNDDCDDDGILNKCDTDNPNYDSFDCDGDSIMNGQDNCPNRANPDQEDDQDCDGILDIDEAEGCVNNPDPDCGDSTPPPTCINDAVCDRFNDQFTKDASALQIIKVAFGDLTLEFIAEGMAVGVTPVVPFEISAMEVTVNGTPVCLTLTNPGEGGRIVIDNLTAADAPISLGLKVNYCSILE